MSLWIVSAEISAPGSGVIPSRSVVQAVRSTLASRLQSFSSPGISIQVLSSNYVASEATLFARLHFDGDISIEEFRRFARELLTDLPVRASLSLALASDESSVWHAIGVGYGEGGRVLRWRSGPKPPEVIHGSEPLP